MYNWVSLYIYLYYIYTCIGHKNPRNPVLNQPELNGMTEGFLKILRCVGAVCRFGFWCRKKKEIDGHSASVGSGVGVVGGCWGMLVTGELGTGAWDTIGLSVILQVLVLEYFGITRL